jgi:hypothetical protein
MLVASMNFEMINNSFDLLSEKGYLNFRTAGVAFITTKFFTIDCLLLRSKDMTDILAHRLVRA